VAFIWLSTSPGAVRGVAGKGSVLLEVAVPSLLLHVARKGGDRAMGVIVGMAPHKRSATIWAASRISDM
jgi:hypothetical protein